MKGINSNQNFKVIDDAGQIPVTMQRRTRPPLEQSVRDMQESLKEITEIGKTKATAAAEEALDNFHFAQKMADPKIPVAQKTIMSQNRALGKLVNSGFGKFIMNIVKKSV